MASSPPLKRKRGPHKIGATERYAIVTYVAEDGSSDVFYVPSSVLGDDDKVTLRVLSGEGEDGEDISWCDAHLCYRMYGWLDDYEDYAANYEERWKRDPQEVSWVEYTTEPGSRTDDDSNCYPVMAHYLILQGWR